MERKDLESRVGKIVCVDMVNRERPVCRLIELTLDGYAVFKDPLVFVPVAVGQNFQVQALSYASPLFEVKKLKVALDHIIALIDVPAQMEQAYTRHTSGLVTDTTPKIIVP